MIREVKWKKEFSLPPALAPGGCYSRDRSSSASEVDDNATRQDCSEIEVVGQKDEMLAGLLVSVVDPSESGVVIIPFGTGQPDDLLGGYTEVAVGFLRLTT